MPPTTRFRAHATARAGLAALAVLLTTAGWSADANVESSMPAPAPAAIDPVLDQQVTSILDEFADPDNALRKTPGADLYRLPTAALPLIINALNLRDLPWAERAALHRAREHLEAQLKGLAIIPASQHMLDCYNAQMVEAYDRVGVRGAWDAQVEEAMRLTATAWAVDPRRSGDEMLRAIPLFDQAIAAGCSDPYVRYLAVRLRERGADPEYPGIAGEEIACAEAIAGTGYSPWVKAALIGHAANNILSQWQGHPAGKHLQLLTAWMAAMPRLLADAALDPHTFTEMSLNSDLEWIGQMAWWTGDRGAAYAQLDAVLRPALPDSPLPLLVEADYDQTWAWEARGSGWASTVTEEGWRLMAERMAKNQAAIARAWQLDPHCRAVAEKALESANGASLGKADVFRWLNRSEAISPGNVESVAPMLNYLEPKWNGSAGEMVQFGRQCLATGDWNCGLPQGLVNAHYALALYANGQYTGHLDVAYFKQPEVWADIQAVYEGALAVRPHDVEAASTYLEYAMTAGRTDVARRLAQQLGDHPWLSAVHGRAAYADQRAQLGLAAHVPADAPPPADTPAPDRY